jgi:hypothetical protein
MQAQMDPPSRYPIVAIRGNAIESVVRIQVSRDNMKIVTERLADKVDPPRSFPLAGPAQLHHYQWKCTVYYNETVESAHPSLDFRSTKPKVQILYVEKDQLRQ